MERERQTNRQTEIEREARNRKKWIKVITAKNQRM